MSCEYNDCLSSSCKECNEASTTPSTPFVSAPSSPKKSTLSTSIDAVSACRPESTNSSDFDFSLCISKSGLSLLYPGSLNPACSTGMSSAEELFQNGQIKPLNARFSACTCCNHVVQRGGSYDISEHTYDPSCPQCAACKGSSLQNVENGQHTARSWHGQVKLPLSESSLGQWRKGVDRNNDKGSASLHALHAHPRVGRVTQIPSLPLASYGKSGSGHHHRRARSLSPLRVFHMDDIIHAPRPSFESELYTHMSSVHTESSFDVAITRPRRRRRGRKSWTLKELLNLGDNKVHDKRSQSGSSTSGSLRDAAKVEGKGKYVDTNMERPDVENVEDKGPSASAADGKSSMHLRNEGGMLSCSPWNLQRALKRAEQEAAVHAEEAKKRTFLSDKKGLLSCLGFTSKLSSVRSSELNAR